MFLAGSSREAVLGAELKRFESWNILSQLEFSAGTLWVINAVHGTHDCI